MIDIKYDKQVDLLLQLIPVINKFDCLALKGGTALNFFVLDAPRLSVDIDLMYIPLKDRDTSLSEISKALKQIKDLISAQFRDIIVSEKIISGGYRISLFISFNEFNGMTRIPVTIEELQATRQQLFDLIPGILSDNEKQFLISLKKGEPEWSLLPVDHINKFLSMQWELYNIKKLDKKKHGEQLRKLEKVLEK